MIQNRLEKTAQHPSIHSGGNALPHHWIGIDKEWEWDPTNFDRYLVSLSPEQMRAHAYLIGATGSGKTNGLHHLIAQDVKLGHSFIVLDMRGDLVEFSLRLCAEQRLQPERIRLLDLREMASPCGFNPLRGKQESYFNALGVRQAILSQVGDLGPQTDDTLRHALSLLADLDLPLTKLEDLFYVRSFRESCFSRCSDGGIKTFWERYSQLSHDRQSILASPVLNKLSLILGAPSLKKILSHPQPLDLHEHLTTNGRVLLISLAADELCGAGKMMGNIIMSAISREIFSRNRQDRQVPVRLYVDEFEHFDPELYEELLVESRKFGLSVVLAHQTLAQLPSRTRSIILGNVGVKLVFRTSYEDSATISKDLCGNGRSFFLPDLGIGQAVLWRRGLGCTRLEINAPLEPALQLRSSQVQAYTERVLTNNGTWREIPVPAQQIAAVSSKKQDSASPIAVSGAVAPETLRATPSPITTHVPASPLEDWLCE